MKTEQASRPDGIHEMTPRESMPENVPLPELFHFDPPGERRERRGDGMGTRRSPADAEQT